MLEWAQMWKEVLLAGTVAAACGGSSGSYEKVQLPSVPSSPTINNHISPPDTGPETPAVVFGENVDCSDPNNFPRPELKTVRKNSTIRTLTTEIDLGDDLANSPIRGPRIVLSKNEHELGVMVPSRQDFSAILSIVRKDKFICCFR